jgi:hypothetical protein
LGPLNADFLDLDGKSKERSATLMTVFDYDIHSEEETNYLIMNAILPFCEWNYLVYHLSF